MASLCKPASQAQPLQEAMLDSLVLYPNNQPQEKHVSSEQRASYSIYQANELALPESSSSLPNYYTTLALGATVVCSAGALMQYTQTGLWHQSDRLMSEKTIVQSEQSEPATAVVTPPISASQTVATFSPRTDTTADCINGSCQGLELPDRSMTQRSKLQALQVEKEQFQIKAALQKLQVQQAILAHRSDDLAHRHAESEMRAQQLNQQFATLSTRLALHPNDAEQIANLLYADVNYQRNRLKLNDLREAIAIEYSRPISDNPQLELLYKQYAREMEQLGQIAQNALANYIANISVEFSDPIWQDEQYYSQLQVLMDVAHLRQMQNIEQNTLTQMEIELSQQQMEVAILLKKNRLS